MSLLANRTWRQADGRPTVVVPVGSTEQHGPHLPLATDTIIAEHVSHLVAQCVDHALVAPAIAYGSSGEHQSFAGTMSVGSDALSVVLVELTRSLSTWAGRVVFVNGHGGNVESLVRAIRQLRIEGHDCAWVPCAGEGFDLHAGHSETSLMLHIRPEVVRMDQAEPGNRQPLAELVGTMRAAGVQAVSSNGVLGDPTTAQASVGESLVAAMVATIGDSIRNWQVLAQGELATVHSADRGPVRS